MTNDPGYDVGYEDGGNSRQQDWHFALTEYCELPDTIDTETPQQVAEYIAKLQTVVAATKTFGDHRVIYEALEALQEHLATG